MTTRKARDRREQRSPENLPIWKKHRQLKSNDDSQISIFDRVLVMN